MKKNNGWPRVKVLESGEIIKIPLKGKKVISRSGREYLRYDKGSYGKKYYDFL